MGRGAPARRLQWGLAELEAVRCRSLRFLESSLVWPESRHPSPAAPLPGSRIRPLPLRCFYLCLLLLPRLLLVCFFLPVLVAGVTTCEQERRPQRGLAGAGRRGPLLGANYSAEQVLRSGGAASPSPCSQRSSCRGGGRQGRRGRDAAHSRHQRKGQQQQQQETGTACRGNSSSWGRLVAAPISSLDTKTH